MNFLQLRYFKAIVTYGSMVAASESVYVSQSAISQAISKLERELNTKLFIRLSNGRLQLNENGKKFLFYCNKILDLEEQAKQAFQTNTPTTHIRLGSAGPRLFTTLMHYYRSANPNVSFSTMVGPRTTTIPALLNDEIDVLIDCGYIDEPERMVPLTLKKYWTDMDLMKEFCEKHELRSFFFYKTHAYLCVSKQSTFASLTTVTMKDLENIPIVRQSHTLDHENWLNELAAFRHVKLNTIMEVDSDTYSDLIFNYGYSSVILSTFCLGDSRYRNNCKLIPIDDPLADRDLYIYFKKGKPEIELFVKETLSSFDWTHLLHEYNPSREKMDSL